MRKVPPLKSPSKAFKKSLKDKALLPNIALHSFMGCFFLYPKLATVSLVDGKKIVEY